MLLHRRATLVPVRAVDTAVARFRLEHGVTAGTLKEKHATVERHGLDRPVRALWTCHRHVQVGHDRVGLDDKVGDVDERMSTIDAPNARRFNMGKLQVFWRSSADNRTPSSAWRDLFQVNRVMTHIPEFRSRLKCLRAR